MQQAYGVTFAEATPNFTRAHRTDSFSGHSFHATLTARLKVIPAQRQVDLLPSEIYRPPCGEQMNFVVWVLRPELRKPGHEPAYGDGRLA